MIKERFTHERNTEGQWMSLQEVATTLSISAATVRNWIKAEKVVADLFEGNLRFQREHVVQLKNEIESGISHRLKSRRNKRAVSGKAVPVEYVSSNQYVQVAEAILEMVARLEQAIEPRLILLEVALGLLLKKQVIQIVDDVNLSLTELILHRKLSLGGTEELLQELWDFQRDQRTQEIKENNEPQEFKILRAIRQLDLEWIPGDDLLGLVYMTLSNLGTRKSQGSYYTPNHLVEDMVEKSLQFMEEVQQPRVVDPCCGSGNFLIKLFLALVKKVERAGKTRAEAEIEVLSTGLYGYDIDPIAVILAKINLVLLLEGNPGKGPRPVFNGILRSLNSNLINKNTLEHYGSLFAQQETTFDLVIGNPPWGSSFTKEEGESYRKSFVTAETSLESFSLFMEYGLSLLNTGGLLSFVLPEALFNVKTHFAIRKLLLENTKLLNIELLGHQFSKVFTPTITLIVQRANPEELLTQGPTHSDFISLHKVKVEIGEGHHFVPQKRFYENEMYIFNVKASNQDDEILEHMKTLPGVLFLAGQADFALGIVTGNNKEFVLNAPVAGAEPVLKGNDIFKYNTYPSENYLIFKPKKFQQVAPVELYRAPEKLLYRFINENLVFAYDDRQTLSLNSGNIVIPRLEGYSMKYVLAILNSRAAQFFHSASFSSVKVLRKHIESIPIPPSSAQEQGHIVKLVDAMISTEDSATRQEIYEEIDKCVMELYGLSAQQEVIRVRTEVVKHLFRG